MDFPDRPLTDWLPVSREEMSALGWEQADIIIVTGDSYVDHPAFGTAVIARLAESKGYKVAVLPQPNWRDDLRDFKKLGAPRLFFGVSSGNMDSMVNHYTAFKRLRSDDAYTAGGKAGFRPDYACNVYSRILKTLYPQIPVVLGGVEASLRRVTHYDYWSDSLLPGILESSGADLLLYGMATLSFALLLEQLRDKSFDACIQSIPQSAFIIPQGAPIPVTQSPETIELPSHEECMQSRYAFTKLFTILETESNRMEAARLVQHNRTHALVINPPWPPLTESQTDMAYELPYTRFPHPRYRKRGLVPAWEMIKHSVNIHQGCFGGCSFCTISAHQGKFISSRSVDSVVKEVEQLTGIKGFKGYISDLGGPSANMWGMKGKKILPCKKCRRPSCIFPSVCPNLDANHERLIALYRKVRQIPGVKKVLVSSGIRHDMLTDPDNVRRRAMHQDEYISEIARFHTGGRLKLAPEHTSSQVLAVMRKPNFRSYLEFRKKFTEASVAAGLKQEIIPYFMSSHPACTLQDMVHLAEETRKMGYYPEQVQDFTPTPMTLASVMYYTGKDPYTGRNIYVARSISEKRTQHQLFFWYKPENRGLISRLSRTQNK